MSLRSMPRRIGPLAIAACAFGLCLTSCGGGGGSGDATQDLVLVSFNLPNIAGVPLNQPLIFTFSDNVDPTSITPDTLRVVGQSGPFFEDIVVDGNLVALIPRIPNFDTYVDSGLQPGTIYTVSLSVFPAASTITSLDGRPLLRAEGYQFITQPAFTFIEPRRPINHGVPPPTGRSDDLGCLQNPDSSLFLSPLGDKQFGSGPGARLLCLINEGAPQVIVDESIPTHDAAAVGTPSAVSPGYVDLPAIRVRVNEPLDPKTVTPISSTSLGVNVQLWRVGDTDKNVLPGNPEQVETNTPVTVQSIGSQEIILVAQHEVLQGTYCVNLRATIQDLTGQPLNTATGPDPNIGGYGSIDASLQGKVPPGLRIYFVTLALPNTPQAFNESFGSNLSEWGDRLSGNTEPGVFTQTVPTTNLADYIGGGGPVPTSPSLTLTNTLTGIGQSTTANWNNGFRFLNLSNLVANADVDSGAGRAKAVWRPYCGTGGDGVLDTTVAPYSPGGGDTVGLSTGPGGNNGIFQYESFHLGVGDTLTATGPNPLVILCRGDFIVDGTIDLSGSAGRYGLDTDGTSAYLPSNGAIPVRGAGGAGGPGAGAGGAGGDPLGGAPIGGNGATGARGLRMDVDGSTPADYVASLGFGGGGGLPGDEVTATPQNPTGGGGGGFGAVGGDATDAVGGTIANGGLTAGSSTFDRPLTDYKPDRGYNPNCDIQAGGGGGGGGLEDDGAGSETGDGLVNNNDDAGGGGGGGGGAILVIAGGNLFVTPSGQIIADGGAGGSTYSKANQVIAPGPDMTPGGTDDFVTGLVLNPVPSGDGAPGAGGSGGGVLLLAQGNVVMAGTISAAGGVAGTSGNPNLTSGDGGGGRMFLGAVPPSSVSLTGTFVAGTGMTGAWNPTVQTSSAAQSSWYDLSSPTADFQPPFYPNNNFAALTGAGLVQGIDWDAVLEFQGALTLSPTPGGLTPPTAGTGITQWSSNVDDVDFKRYIRYRWRFFAADTFPGHQLSTSPPGTAEPMPAVLDLTVPFTR